MSAKEWAHVVGTSNSWARGRRRPVVPALLVALALVAGACGGNDTDDGDGSSGDGGAATAGSGDSSGGEGGDGGGFPVTVEHTYGATTIEDRPERVVTVGLTDHDAVLALGVVPVGTTDWFGDHPGAVWPWAQDELEALGGPPPELVGDASALNFESIAAARPDVILALYAGLTETDYETLSEIAPTVAQPEGVIDYGIAWDEQVRVAGEVLGETGRADELIAGVEQRFADVRADHPEFEGLEGLVVSPYNDLFSVFAPQDPRGRFMADLGFVQPAEIEELAGDAFSADLSAERSDLLDVDVIVWIVTSIESDVARFDDDPVYSALDVHTGGHEAFVENLGPVGGATSFVTVLSLPFLIDELVPQIADAVAGDAA
jgi:iron complex transport system substrate-binding protein